MVIKTCLTAFGSLVASTAVAWGDVPPAAPVPGPMPTEVDPLPPAPPPGIPSAPLWTPGSPSTGVNPQNLPMQTQIAPSPDPLTSAPVVSPGAASAGVRSGTWGAGPAAGYGPYWAPGGYEARIGSPYMYHDPNGGQYVVTGNPYYDHFGPGFHRESLHGHYRFPYYNYRAPWYYPGRAVYNRDTNFPW